MAELKTKPTRASVPAFLQTIAAPERRADARAICALMKTLTGEKPVLWGDSIVGFGAYAYRYPSGQSGRWFLTGFSPRKAALTLYIMPGFGAYDGGAVGTEALLKRLGPHKTGKACLYVKRLRDLDPDVLAQIITRSVAVMRERYPA